MTRFNRKRSPIVIVSAMVGRAVARGENLEFGMSDWGFKETASYQLFLDSITRMIWFGNDFRVCRMLVDFCMVLLPFPWLWPAVSLPEISRWVKQPTWKNFWVSLKHQRWFCENSLLKHHQTWWEFQKRQRRSTKEIRDHNQRRSKKLQVILFDHRLLMFLVPFLEWQSPSTPVTLLL